MKREETMMCVCPRCGGTYTEHPALSRVDNETLICPDCGVREALESIGVAPAEQNKIIQTIHEHTDHSHLQIVSK